MKNREKYTNIVDAVKAYEEHKKEHNCDCTFEDWLDRDEDKIKEIEDKLGDKLGGLFAASIFGPIGMGLLASFKRRQSEASNAKSDSEKPKQDEGNGGEIMGVECPRCHGKRGSLRSGRLYADFYCPDCDALICKKADVVRAPFGSSSLDEFKAWFGKFTSAAKKD